MNWHILSKNYISSQCQQIGSTIYCHASLQKIWLPLPPFRDFRFVWVWKSAQPFKSSFHFLAIKNIYNFWAKIVIFEKMSAITVFLNICIWGIKSKHIFFLHFFACLADIWSFTAPTHPFSQNFLWKFSIFFQECKISFKKLNFLSGISNIYFFKF